MSEAAIRRVFLGLFFLSGFSALVYQVLWFRVLSLILGGSVVTTATVLAAFMAGLALGSRLAAWIAPRLRSPLRAYALLEVVVGLAGVLSPAVLSGMAMLFLRLSPDPAENAPAGLALLRAGLALLVLLVPTTAMGATLPVLVSRFVRRWEEAGVRVGSLYAANLWGAVGGVFLGGFLLLPLVGVRLGVVIAAAINLAIAGVAWILSGRVPGAPPAQDPAEASPNALLRGVLAVFLVAGFCSFVYEVLWTRLLVLHLGSSAYAFSLMLTLFLTGLALGGAAGGWAADRLSRAVPALAVVEWGVGLLTLAALLYLPLLPRALEAAAERMGGDGIGFGVLTAASGVAVAPLLLPSTFLIGASFPLGARILIRDPAFSGREVGRLYAWNTTGNILGAVAGGFLLLPLLGAQGGLMATAALNVLAGVLLLFLGMRPAWRAALLAGAGVAVFLALAWPVSRTDAVRTAGIYTEEPGRRILHMEETAQGTITLAEIRQEEGVWKSLDVDGINVAGTSPALVAIQKLQGHLPLLLHPDPKSVLHIGFGSGGTAYAVSTHSSVETIDILEINPAVLRTSDRHLREVNGGVLEDPRVRLVLDDGRNYLAATNQFYDVILSDAVHPRYAGNSALYTTDYFRMASRRLRPGGLMSMWLPIYGLSPDSYRMILASMRAVYPDTSVWYVNSTINEFCIVVGRTGGPTIDVDRIARALEEPAVRKDLLPVGATTPHEVIDYLVAQGPDLTPALADTPLSFDDRPLVEYLSARHLDRTLSWIQNFQILVDIRTHRPDLLRGRLVDGPFLARHARDFEATTWNLEGQVHILRSGYPRLSEEERGRSLKEADRAFRRARQVAPDSKEPWEWFGLPADYPAEWNR